MSCAQELHMKLVAIQQLQEEVIAEMRAHPELDQRRVSIANTEFEKALIYAESVVCPHFNHTPR